MLTDKNRESRAIKALQIGDTKTAKRMVSCIEDAKWRKQMTQFVMQFIKSHPQVQSVA